MTDRWNPVEGMRPTSPPTGLRVRVLASARGATAKEGFRESWIDRVWESRRIRWAAALTASLLLAGHLALAPSRTAGPRPSASNFESSIESLPSGPSGPTIEQARTNRVYLDLEAAL